MNEESDRETFSLLMSKDAEVDRLTEKNEELDLGMKEATKKIFDQMAQLSRKDHLITELADALHEANELLLYKYGAERSLSVDELIKRARKANAAKKAKSDERRMLKDLQKMINELDDPKLLASVEKRLTEAKREKK